MSSTMKAVLLKQFGGPEQMFIGEAAKPAPKNTEILIRVKAAGLNRSDTHQRQGEYPSLKLTDIIGLEVAGIVEEVGSEVENWKVGDHVMALLSGGGGYAQFVSVPSTHALRIPTGYTFERAAGIMETYLTTFQSLMWLGKVQQGEKVLIHGGASGIGTSAIQLALSIAGVRVFATAGTDDKCLLCEKLGAEKAINYRTNPDFDKIIADLTQYDTDGPGVDFILDFVGQEYLERNLRLLRTDGRLVYLSMLSGPIAQNIDISSILFKRLSLIGSTLRFRSSEYKSKLIADFGSYASQLLDAGKLVPIIDKVCDWSEIGTLHQEIESNKNTGKLIITGM